jgi:hypothetical protein
MDVNKNEDYKMALNDFAIVHWFNGLLGKNKAEEDLKQVAEAHERVDEDVFRKEVKEKLGGIDHVAEDLHAVSALALRIQEQNEKEKVELDRLMSQVVEIAKVSKKRFSDEEMIKFLGYSNKLAALNEKLVLKDQEERNHISKVKVLYKSSNNEYPFNNEHITNISIEDLKGLLELKQKTVDGYGICNTEKEHLYQEYIKTQRERDTWVNTFVWNQFSASESLKNEFEDKRKKLESLTIPVSDYGNMITDELAARVFRGERV